MMTDKRILIAVADMTEEEKTRRNEFDTSLDDYSIERNFFSKFDNVDLLRVNDQDIAEKEELKKKILEFSPACVFNRFEGWSDDSYKEIEFARILEEMGMPFTGNTSYTLGLCLDKWTAKQALKAHGLPVPPGIFINDPDSIDTRGLDFPLFVKPCFEDASIGIDNSSFVKDEAELQRSVEMKLKDFPKGVIAEEFMTGKEYTMGIIGNSPYEILGISVLDYTKHGGTVSYLTYDSKWISNSPEYKLLMPSLDERIEPGIEKTLRGIAAGTAEAFKCRGYFRIDTREKNGKLCVIDVNPNPDISEDGGFMRQAFRKGYTYDSVIEKIIELAGERFEGSGIR